MGRSERGRGRTAWTPAGCGGIVCHLQRTRILAVRPMTRPPIALALAAALTATCATLVALPAGAQAPAAATAPHPDAARDSTRDPAGGSAADAPSDVATDAPSRLGGWSVEAWAGFSTRSTHLG